MKKFAWINEKYLVYILIALSLVFIAFDFFHISIILEMKFQGFESLMTTIFQVQATVVSLGIALLTMITCVSGKMVFGMTLTKYIIEEKPELLKHKSIVLMEFILIIINYFFMIFYFYATFIYLFCISIFFIGWMSKSIFKVFDGERELEKEIEKHFMKFFITNKMPSKQKAFINNIVSDIKFAANINDISRVEKDLAVLEKIFKFLMKGYGESTLFWSKHYREICVFLVEKKSLWISNAGMKSICNILRIDKRYNNNNKVNLYLGNFIYRHFFQALSVFGYEVLFNDGGSGLILRLKFLLLVNANQKGDFQSVSFLNRYSSEVYYYYFRDNKELTDNELIRGKIALYCDYEKFLYNDFLQKNILFDDLAEYTKRLIDFCEKEVLKETFAKILKNISEDCYVSDRKNFDLKCQYIFKIEIYLYYIAFNEELVGKEQKEFACNFLNEHRKDNDIFSIFDLPINNEFIEQIKIIAHNWKIYGEGAKILVLESLVDKFFLYFMLITSQRYNIEDNLSKIIDERIGLFYLEYATKSDDELTDDLKVFIQNFYPKNENNENEIATEKVRLLKEVLNKMYFSYKIEEANLVNEKISDISDLKNKLSQFLKNNINLDLNNFKGCNFNVNKQIFNFEIGEYTIDMLLKENINRNQTLCRDWFWLNFIELVNSYLIKKEVKVDDSNHLDDFLDLVNSVNSELDILVGYRKYWGNESINEKFKKFENGKNKIEISYMYNKIIALDSKNIYIKLTDINVDIHKLSEDEMLKGIKKCEADSKYSYKVMNENFYEFEKDELLKYLTATKRKIVVQFSIEYAFNKNDIGIFYSLKA